MNRWLKNKVFQALLSKPNIDVNLSNKSGVSPLKAALLHNHTGIAICLLQDRSDLNVSSQGLLHIAAERNFVNVITALLNHNGTDVNERDESGQTAIMVAAKRGNLEAAEALLLDSTDLFSKDNLGYPALLLAAINGHRSVLDLLKSYLNDNPRPLNDFVNQTILDNSGWFPLMEASLYGRSELVKKMLFRLR